MFSDNQLLGSFIVTVLVIKFDTLFSLLQFLFSDGIHFFNFFGNQLSLFFLVIALMALFFRYTFYNYLFIIVLLSFSCSLVFLDTTSKSWWWWYYDILLIVALFNGIFYIKINFTCTLTSYQELTEWSFLSLKFIEKLWHSIIINILTIEYWFISDYSWETTVNWNRFSSFFWLTFHFKQRTFQLYAIFRFI